MRIFIQIIATLTFLLAGSQFAHAHEVTSAKPHVHAHETQVLHSGTADLHQEEQNGSIHCVAYLLSQTAAPGVICPVSFQTFSYWISDRLPSGQISLELPPPRA